MQTIQVNSWAGLNPVVAEKSGLPLKVVSLTPNMVLVSILLLMVHDLASPIVPDLRVLA